LYNNLKVIKPGTSLFSIKKADFLPSHELAISTGLKKEAFPVVEINLHDALAYLSRNIFSLKSDIKGWNLLIYNGVNLGFVNNIGSRFNNYFPVEWRIRMNIPAPGDFTLIDWE
jgi:NOL1/NOP2/fmu family ribosome biogenesis protein